MDSEGAGQKNFGFGATIKKVEGDEALLDFDTTKGVESLPLKMLAPKSDFAVLKPEMKIKGFHAVTRPEVKRILQFAGYRVQGAGGGDTVQDETKAGSMIYSLNLAAGFRLMQMCLDMKGEVEFVHPDLLKTYMEGRAGPAEGADEAFVEEFMKGQVKRSELLKKKLGMKRIIVMPVHCKSHWTLVVVDGRESGEPVLRYMDSLRSEGMVLEVWTYVNEGLKELMGWSLPKRWNEGRQPLGSDVCGAFVLHYMEQCIRALLLQEPWSSLGWPSSGVWGDRVHKLARSMKNEQDKIKKEDEKEEEKKKKEEEKKKNEEEKKKKTGVVDAKVAALGEAADALVKKIPPGKPCLENLSAKALEEVKHVHFTGVGVCSKCRWSSGCLECHGPHALLYWLKKEGFDGEAIVHLDAQAELKKL